MKKVVILFLIALTLRLSFLGFWYFSGQGDRVSSDGRGYYELAKNVREGSGFQLQGEPSLRRPPLYPLMVSLLTVFFPFPFIVQLGQVFLGAANCVLLYLLGRRLFDERVGLLAGGILAVDYLSIRQTASIMPETLFIFFLLTSFYFLYGIREREGPAPAVWSGLFAGLSLLTRDVLILYFPLAFLWLIFWKKEGTRNFKNAFAFAAALFLTVTPWILRNSLLAGRLTPITVGAGASFYLANNPMVTGGGTGGDWELGRETYFWDPREAKDLPLPQLYTHEAEEALFQKGFKFIQEEPGQFFSLMGKKILNMWQPYQADSPRLAQAAQAASYLPVMILGLAGIFLNLKRWREFLPIFGLFAYIFLLHAVLIAHIRYRYPVMPFLMIFAAFGLVRFLSGIMWPSKS